MYAIWPPKSMEHLIIAETSDTFDEAEGTLNTSETLNHLQKSIENASLNHEFWTQHCATKIVAQNRDNYRYIKQNAIR